MYCTFKRTIFLYQKQLSQQKSEDAGGAGERPGGPMPPSVQEVVVNGTGANSPPGKTGNTQNSLWISFWPIFFALALVNKTSEMYRVSPAYLHIKCCCVT